MSGASSPRSMLDWPKLAERLAEQLPRERLEPAVLSVLQPTIGREPWLVACSGGVDSLALLLLLHALFPEQRPWLRVVHFNHRVRQDSCNDARFVAAVVAGLGLAYSVGQPTALIPPQANEERLRAARFSFIHKIAADYQVRLILQGHQQNDIAETLLMRLSSGSGIDGLVAPRPIHKHRDGTQHLRPLLQLQKQELVTVMQKLGIPWCEDSSNSAQHYYRNRIRQQVLPAWAANSPSDLLSGVARTRDLLQEDAEALEAWVDELLPQSLANDLSVSPWLSLPRAIIRRILYRWLQENNLACSVRRAAFELLLEAVVTGEHRVVRIAESCTIVCDQHRLWRQKELAVIKAQPWCVPLVLDQWRSLPSGGATRGSTLEVNAPLRAQLAARAIDPFCEAYLAVDTIDLAKLTIRCWQAGDRYHPLNAPGTRKVQDLFVDRKVDRTIRKLLPVYCLDDKPLWVPGFAPAHENRILRTTMRALRLTYKPPEKYNGGF